MKKIYFRRSAAFVMATCMVGTIIPASSFAYATEHNSEVIQVTNFEQLSEEVRVHNIPLGTSFVDLGLPSELVATVYSATEDQTPVLPSEPNDSGKADALPEVPPTPTVPTPPLAPPVSGNNAEVEPEQSKPETVPIKTLVQIEETNIPLATTPSSLEQAEEPAQPQTKAVAISGVTWKSTPLYAENTVGEYLFTPVLPKPYAVAEGVTMPEILVTVYDNAKVIRSWTWNDPDGVISEGILALPGVNQDNPIDLATIVSMLPASINATMDAQPTQDGVKVDNAPVPLALTWGSKDFVPTEDGSLPIQGTYHFTAAMPEDYTLSANTLPLEIIVQLGGAMLLPAGDVFTKLEIRQGSADGDVMVNLLNQASLDADWKLAVATDYYLCAELQKPTDATHMQIRIGKENGTYNGVFVSNPIGGKYDTGVISDDYFDELTTYEKFADPIYGKEKTLDLKDGAMTYQIKSKPEGDNKVAFNLGFMVSDEVYEGKAIANAIGVSLGTHNDTAFIPNADATATREISLKLEDKVVAKALFTAGVQKAAIGAKGGVCTYYPVSTSSVSKVAFLYDQLDFDFTYPAGAELEIGFVADATTLASDVHGTITLGDPTPVEGDTKLQKSHISISKGLRGKDVNFAIYVRLSFPDNGTFEPGQKHYITASDTSIKVGNATFTSIPNAGDKNTASYALVEGGLDGTTLVGSSRTVYNHTIDLGEGKQYNLPLGTAIVKNTSAGEETPYGKTFEAQYNTGGTAANIAQITIPKGTNKLMKIHWTGVDASGAPQSGTVDNPIKYLNNAKWESGMYFLLPAKEFGIVSFTSAKADIGKLGITYNNTSGDATYFTYPNTVCSAYGYFTKAEAGLVVNNSFRIYNTEVAEQAKPNGDLYAEGIAISSDFCGMAVAETAEIYFENEVDASTKIGKDSAIQAGKIATISGLVNPYKIPSYTYNEDKIKGTTILVNDPIFYLTLPQGFTLVEDKLKFSATIHRYYAGAVTRTEALSHTIENVSHMNKTGDGVTIYKITFPTNTKWGYYDENNEQRTLLYEIPLRTSKSLSTKRYLLKDLVSITAKNGMTMLKYENTNRGNIAYVKEDIYGLNGGKPMAAITGDSEADLSADMGIGFSVQQQAEINVYSSASVTKINGQAVPEKWYSYDSSNPNSIAMLGKNSEGRLRLQVSNTSATQGEKFAMVLPLPKSTVDLGDVFMEKAPEFDLSVEYDKVASDNNFEVKYIKIDGTNDTIPAEGIDKITQQEVPANEANAVLLTAKNSVDRGEYFLYLKFKLTNGTPKATNIWRPAYSYAMSNKNHQSYGSYVASSVAGSGIKGVVFNDTNRNGRKDIGESGVSEVLVVAKDENNRILSAKTDTDGKYEFLAVRESNIALNFTLNTEEHSSLRFNVPPLMDSATDTVSTVLPDANGLGAAKTLASTGDTINVNAAVSGFITLTYNGNGNTSGNLPKTSEYVFGETGTVAVKPDNLVKTGYRFVGWDTSADGTGTRYQQGNTLTISKNITLYAIWEITSYTVTFNYRGATTGNTEGSRIIQHNESYSPLPKPEKTGYSFAGWASTSAGTKADVTDAKNFITGADTTIYALWTPKTGFTVKYDTKGGNIIVDKSVAWTDTVLPTNPTQSGYDFVEWRYNGAKVNKTDTFEALATSDATGTSITLNAIWKAKTGYTVNYDTAGGTPAAITAKAVIWSEKNLLPPNPTKASKAFAGWKLDAVDVIIVDNTKSYGELAKTDTITSIKLIAQWAETTGNTVSYDTDGGSSVNDKLNVASDAKNLLPDPAPTKPGYVLEKWLLSSDMITEVTNETVYNTISSVNTVTLKAVWTDETYTIKYVPNNDGTIPDKTNAKWVGANLLPTEPTREGYIFAGWYYNDTKLTASSTVSSLIPDDDIADNTLTLKAQWTERTYTVEYNSDGGTIFTPKTVKYTDDGLLPETTPVKKGYTFKGWYVGSSNITAATVCSSLLTADDTVRKITLLATWEVKTGFTVKYDTAGGTAANPTSKTVAWNGANLLPTNTITKNGYDLNVWTVGRIPVTDATAYSLVAESDQTSSIVTLVAVWKEKTGYKVTYDTAGGTTIAEKTVSWIQNVSPNSFPSRKGYTFSGWKHGENPVVDGAKYSELVLQDTTKEIELTAVWAEKSDYTITYNTDGGSAVDDKTGVKWTEKDLLPNTDPIQNGYTFTGWYYGETKVSVATTVSALIPLDDTKTILLTAHWTKDPEKSPDISGTVKDEKGTPVSDAKVRLTKGNTTMYETTTNGEGNYLLSNLSPGIYNLVAEKNRQTVTVIVTLIDRDLSQALVLPEKKKSSVLDVIGSDTPPVVVGNLDEIAQSIPLEVGDTSLTIKLTVQKEAEESILKQTEHKAIRKETGTNATILFLDAQLTKQIDANLPTSIGNSNSVVLEVVVPFDLVGKENVQVYRYHTTVNPFRQLPTMPTGTLEDQTCYLNESAGLIHIYAQKYSTYAISYDVKSGGGEEKPDEGGNGSSGGGSGSGSGENHTQDFDIFQSAGTGEHIQPNESEVTVRESNGTGFQFKPAQPKPPVTTPAILGKGGMAPTKPDKTTEVETTSPTPETPEKVLHTQSAPTSSPFILFSALLTLLGVICALFTLLRKCSKKTRAVATIVALLTVIIFFLTSGWSGIQLANIWTVLIAVLTAFLVWLMFQTVKDDDSQETH